MVAGTSHPERVAAAARLLLHECPAKGAVLVDREEPAGVTARQHRVRANVTSHLEPVAAAQGCYSTSYHLST